MANEAAAPGGPVDTKTVGRWALGLAGTWFVLTMMADSGWGELASALALVIAGSVLIDQGPGAIRNLGFLAQ